MWPWDAFRDPMWRPLATTLLHFVWQGLVVAAAWKVLFRCSRGCRTQTEYLLGLAGLLVLTACPLTTFALLKSNARTDAAPEIAVGMPTWHTVNSRPMPTVGIDTSTTLVPAQGEERWPSCLQDWADAGQPYLIAGWIVGLTILSGRLFCGVIGARRLRRGRRPVSAELADRAAALAKRLGLKVAPGVFVSDVVREAVVSGLLRPIVLLPVAWLLEMTPEVLEAVIAHELAHIRRFDLWVNLFQRLVETILFYHPAVWWLSHRVRVAREMCCDELAVVATGERVVYATALEFAAQRRLASTNPLLEVALGATRMTLLSRVRNVLGLPDGERKGRWWPTVTLGLLVVLVVCTALAWVGHGRYRAISFLRVAMQEKSIAFAVDNQIADRDRFEIYKNTQEQLVMSRFVLLAALRKREVTRLPAVQQAMQAGDVVDWLSRRLRVRFPGNAEIMEVSAWSHDPQEAATLAHAVVDSYVTEVVDAERNQKRVRLSELDRAYIEKETDIRCKREDMKKLAETLGTSDSETLSVKQKLALEELGMYRQELARLRSEARRLQGELLVQKALLKNVGAMELDDDEVDLRTQNDPIAKQLSEELARQENANAHGIATGETGGKSENAEPAQKDLKTSRNKLDARRTELLTLVQKKNRKAIQKEIQRIETSISALTEQQREQERLVEDMQKEVYKFGSSTVDIEMMRADIKNLDVVLTDITQEREKLRVEIRSAPRVTLLYRADPPEVPVWW